ncbi:MAG: hypothetical protein AABX39_03815 [Nanoarchaeota archaeon]
MSLKIRLFLKKLAEAKDSLESKKLKREKERMIGMLEGIELVYSAIKNELSSTSKKVIESKIDVLNKILHS